MNFIQQMLAAANVQVHHAFHATFTEALALDAQTVLSWVRTDAAFFDEEGDEDHEIFLHRVELPLFDVLNFEKQREIAEHIAAQFQESHGLYIPVYGDEENGTLIAYLASEALTEQECAMFFDDIEDDEDEGDEPDPKTPNETKPLVLVPSILKADANQNTTQESAAEPAPIAAEIEADEFEFDTPENSGEQVADEATQDEEEQDKALSVDPADASHEKFVDEVQEEQPAKTETPVDVSDDADLNAAIAAEADNVAQDQEEQKLADLAQQEAHAVRERMYAEIQEILPNESIAERLGNGSMQVMMEARNGETLTLTIDVSEQEILGRRMNTITMTTEGSTDKVQVIRVAQLADYFSTM